jgi:hypothetical protein
MGVGDRRLGGVSLHQISRGELLRPFVIKLALTILSGVLKRSKFCERK